MTAVSSPLVPGDYAPWFHAKALSGADRYAFDTVAGRLVLMLFFGSTSHGPCADALQTVACHRHLFDDENVAFFGVTVDPRDAASGRIAQQLPGIRFFLDYDKKVSRLYGASLGESEYAPHWLVLDRELRVVRRFALDEGEEAIAFLAARLGKAAGGDLRFPEFGEHTYRAPTGGAIVFSCSLLHEATPVTRGKRYAFLPFLYDEAAAEVRRENLHLLAEQSADQNAGS